MIRLHAVGVLLLMFSMAGCPCAAMADIVATVELPANTSEKGNHDVFVSIPRPPDAPAQTDWFECAPSDKWATWLSDGKVEFYLDTLREGDDTFKACRMRINKATTVSSRGAFSRLIHPALPGYVYRIHLTYRCPAPDATPVALRPVVRTDKGNTYATTRIPSSREWTTYVTPWLAVSSAHAQIEPEIFFRLTNSGAEHQDCWVRTIRIERTRASLVAPADEAVVVDPAPVFSWYVARMDRLQVSRTAEFPEGDATRSVGRKDMPMPSYRFAARFTAGTYYWRVGMDDGQGNTHWVGPNRFTIAPRPAGRWAFDFGPENSQVDPDATSITPASLYTPERGFGFINAQNLESYSEKDKDYRAFEFFDEPATWRGKDGKTYNLNRKLTLNTPISRDYIQGEGPCKFRVDLPDGDYRILLLAGHPTLEGQRPRVFEFEARTNRSTVRFQKTFPYAWFELHPLKAVAEGGRLEIDLVPTGGDNRWVVNGILVMSETAVRSDWGRAEWKRWYSDIFTASGDVVDGIMPDWEAEFAAKQGKPPVPTQIEQQRGFMLFTRGMKEALHPRSVPKAEERLEGLQEIGSSGEPVHLSLSIYALRNIYGAVLSVGALRSDDGLIISADQVNVRWVMARTDVCWKQSYRDWTPLLMPSEPLDLEVARTQQYVLTVNIPANARPGSYRGEVTLSDERGVAGRLPLELTVIPTRLLPARMFLALNATDHCEPRANDPPGVRRLLALGRQAAWESLATHGFTVVEFGGTLRTIATPAGPAPDTERLRARIASFREAGGTAQDALVDLQGTVIRELLRSWAPDEAPKHEGKRLKGAITLTPLFCEEFPKFIRCVDDSLREQGIDRVAYQVHDEPHASAAELQFVRDIGILIRKACPQSFVYVNTMNGPYHQYFESAPELNGRPVANMWWVYGGIQEAERERYATRGVILLGNVGSRGLEREQPGFIGWRIRQSGAWDWTYNNFYGSANSGSDGVDWGGDAAQILPTAPVISLYRWDLIQQGVYDRRYIQTLEAAIAEARMSKDAKKIEAATSGQVLLDRLWKQIAPPGIGTLDPSKARRDIIHATLAIYPRGLPAEAVERLTPTMPSARPHPVVVAPGVNPVEEN